MSEANQEETPNRSRHKGRTWALVVIVAHTLGFVSSLFALSGTRTSQGTIAWIVSLNTIPYVAVPAYWVLGRSRFQGYVTARREEDVELAVLAAGLDVEIDSFEVDIPSERGGIGAAERLAQLPFTRRNGAELLIDGDATFESIFSGIEQAQDYVLVQFFIVKDDGLGRRLQDALIRKARAGVRVYFLYDEIGSHKLPDAYLDELRAAGVEAQSFHSTRGLRNRFQLNFRNHRKIVVVDGLQAWVGGHNVGDEYLGLDKAFGPWRDTHLRLSGPTVQALQISFAEDWHWATDDTLQVDWHPRASEEGDLAALVVPSGPADRVETAWLLYQLALHSARERIWIASPYFVPDEAIMGALQIAALRGVDVRVLIPDDPDHLLVYLSAFAYLPEALDSGVQIYRYTEGFLHQKAFLIDDAVGGIGTVNLDNRSFRLNFEVTAIVVDLGFGKQVEDMFEADFARARLMTRADINEKPLWFKLGVLAARLTAPIQ
jgi:cardiolipin synthase